VINEKTKDLVMDVEFSSAFSGQAEVDFLVLTKKVGTLRVGLLT